MLQAKAANERLSDFTALTVLVALILWFCDSLIFSNQVPFFRDLGNYFYPLRWSLYESYRLGELPLWNRHFAQGFPLLAAFQTGTFYVPHALFIFLPFFVAIRALFVFHFLIAAIGTYTLLRYWRYPPYLSIIGGLLLTLGGSVVSLTNLLNHFQAAVWLPWVLLMWERLLSSPRWNKFIIFTLVVAVQFLAGSPELFLMSMTFVLIDGFRLSSIEPEVSWRRILALFSGGMMLVLAINMVQLLPTAELFFESRRQHPIPTEEALSWSLRPLNLLNLFWLDKELDESRFTGIRTLVVQGPRFYVSTYLGAVSIFGILSWCFYSSSRERVLVTGLFVASVVLAVGGYTPIFPFLYNHIPFFSALRFPEKFLFFSTALIIFVTVKGLGELLREEKGAIGSLILGFISLTWLLVYLILRFNPALVMNFIVRHSGSELSSTHIVAMASLLANVERQVILAIGISCVLYLVKRNTIRLSIFSLLLVSIVYADLANAHRGFLFPLVPDFVQTGDRIVSPGETRTSRIFYYPSARNLHPAVVSVKGRPSFREATALSFHNLLPNAGVLDGIDYMQEIDALGRQPYSEFLYFANELNISRQIKLLRTFNVEYVVSFNSLSAAGLSLVGQFPEYFSWLYRIEGPVPRSYVVNESIVETDSVRVLQSIASADFDPMRHVILDQEPGIKARHPLVATVDLIRYEHQAVTIHATLNDSAILVLADSYYPGWKAYVERKELPIMRANHFFRAVVLPAGNHVVEFRYEPRSFKIGAAISLSTIASLIGISILLVVRRRKISRVPALP